MNAINTSSSRILKSKTQPIQNKKLLPQSPNKIQNTNLPKNKVNTQRKLVSIQKVKNLALKTQIYMHNKPNESISKRKFLPIIPYPINQHIKNNQSKLQNTQQQTCNLLLQQTKVLVTAKKWAIYDQNKNTLIKGFKIKKPHEIASLTKLMTFYCTHLIVNRYYIAIQKLQLLISYTGQQLKGTKANIFKDELISLQDLLYGMMLNSGNDAAYTIATNLGLLIEKKKKGEYFSTFDVKNSKRQDYEKVFVRLMNSVAKQLNMRESIFSNSHGIQQNESSIRDLFMLTQQCLKIELFRKICECKKYTAKAKFINSIGNIENRTITFINTNKLLSNPKYKGIKTGYSQQAGSCLIALYQHKQISLIIYVLGSSSKQAKFQDTQKLLQWYLKTIDK